MVEESSKLPVAVLQHGTKLLINDCLGFMHRKFGYRPTFGAVCSFDLMLMKISIFIRSFLSIGQTFHELCRDDPRRNTFKKQDHKETAVYTKALHYELCELLAGTKFDFFVSSMEECKVSLFKLSGS